MRRWIMLVLALCLCLAMPVSAFASSEISYVERAWNGSAVTETTKSVTDYITVTENTSKWSDGWYVVEGTVSISGRVEVQGEVHLILTDGAKLSVQGITVPRGKSLTIYGQDSGTGLLDVYNWKGEYSAGIGCGEGDSEAYGTIKIHGGEIDVATLGFGPGIGGSKGTLVIYGGKVSASGTCGFGTRSRGRSTSANVDNGTITIYGGEIDASGGIIGIGTADEIYSGTRDTCTLNIYGGDIKTSGPKGGIRCGSVNIHGGTITARATGNTYISAAITGSESKVVITGGNLLTIPNLGEHFDVASLKDEYGRSVKRCVVTIAGAKNQTPVAGLEDVIRYGFYDVDTIGDKLYLYRAVTEEENTVYRCNRNQVYYKEHGTRVDATCIMGEHCSECGIVFGDKGPHTYRYLPLDADTHSRVCDVCSDTVVLAHSFDGAEDTVCDDCGYEIPSEEKFTLSGANMKLGGELEMFFYIPKAELDGENYYAKIVKTYSDGRDDLVLTVPYADWEIYNSSLLRVKLSGISAKEMADEIYVTVYHGTDIAASETWTDSIQTYAQRSIANDANGPKVKTMMVDMLNYGAAAQGIFEYGVDDLANAQLTPEQQTLATQTIDLTDNRVKGENYKGTSLSLKSSIIITFYFENITPDMTAVATFKNHYGADKTVTIEGENFFKRGSMYGIDVAGLVVADGRQVVEVKVYDASGNVVASASDSIESYVARMSASDALYEMAMKFVESSYQYLHSLG